MKKVAIFGPPRSGTTWLAHIFNSHPGIILRHQPLFSFGHKGAITATSNYDEIIQFFDDIVITKDPYVLMQSEDQKEYPVFTKSSRPTHVAFKETRYLNVISAILKSEVDIRVVGVIRNPLATLASWINAPKEFSAEWDVEEEWRCAPKKNKGRDEEFFGFEKWKAAAFDFIELQKKYPDRFKLVKYGDLNSDPIAVVKDIFDFCELSFLEQTREFIVLSRSRHDENPYSVYRAKASDTRWQDTLPDSIVNAVYEDLCGTPLEKYLL